ncbi:MAG: FAD-dependent oxidoreductase [Pseudomonadota bacterium]
MDQQNDAHVVVIGGGTAGSGAAVAAGQQGMSVTLIEAATKAAG